MAGIIVRMKYKNDEYKQVRGGYSRGYQIFCRKCNKPICAYQKDGPGNLRRLYLDRMSQLGVSATKKELVCSVGHVLGIKIVHAEHGESRPAFRLFVDAIIKLPIKNKISK